MRHNQSERLKKELGNPDEYSQMYPGMKEYVSIKVGGATNRDFQMIIYVGGASGLHSVCEATSQNGGDGRCYGQNWGNGGYYGLNYFELFLAWPNQFLHRFVNKPFF